MVASELQIVVVVNFVNVALVVDRRHAAAEGTTVGGNCLCVENS